MGDLPSSPSWHSAVVHQIDLAPAGSPQPGNLDLLDVLRQSLNDATQSTDSILTAVADAARVLSGADGTALALRHNGSVICRARSGSLAPGLGSRLDAGSGISGECLRTGSVLISKDALSDERVDPEVCRELGIRSIAAVPLRGRFGTAGILESFSTHPGTFDNEQIDCLRALAEIAERAHEREPSTLPPVPLSEIRAALFNAAAADRWRIPALLHKDFLKKHYRILAAVAAALIVIAMVVQTSWRQTQAEIAATERPARTASPTAIRPNPTSARPSSSLSPVGSGSPIATVRSNDPRTTRPLQPAAERDSESDSPAASDRSEPALRPTPVSPAIRPPVNRAAETPSNVEPPTIKLASSEYSASPITVRTSSAPVPEFGGNVSHGVKEATLLHRVEPVYPLPARIQRLAGPVILDVTIAPDGTVRTAKALSGPSLLAESAVAAVRQWRYSPAMLGGKPVEVPMRITVVFKLP